MTPIEARFEMERQLLERGRKNGEPVALIRDVRFFLYPSADNRRVLAVAELMDGEDLQVLCELPVPIDNEDDFNEAAVRDLFLAMPSGARH